MSNHFQYFLNQKFDKWSSPEISEDTLNICQQWIEDEDYFDFLSYIGNGGFFWRQSLQIYDLGDDKNFNNILSVNTTLVKEFGDIFKDLFSFAQDIFGDQFVFDKSRNEFAHFIAESGEREPMGKTFSEWLDIFAANSESYSGIGYERKWKLQHELPIDHRLMASKPFIIGGDYDVSNFMSKAYPKYHHFNAEIARQIVNLPDGQKVKLIVKNNKDNF